MSLASTQLLINYAFLTAISIQFLIQVASDVELTYFLSYIDVMNYLCHLDQSHGWVQFAGAASLTKIRRI